MRKLKLHVDQLCVESFQTADADRPLGTVMGNNDSIVDPGCVTYETACPDPTCHANTQCCSGYTCAYTCGSTCGCGGTRLRTCGCPTEFYTDCCQTNEPC
jgi:hypothetical protein